MNEKFPYLIILSKIAKVFGWLWLITGFVIFFVILVGGIDVNVLGMKVVAKGGWNLFSSLYYLAYGLTVFLVFNGLGEFILLLVSIEENTRR